VPEEIIIPVAKAHSDVDDETVTYILATRKHFEDLRQVAAQLAGLLVLAAVGAQGATPHYPLLEAAERLYESAWNDIRGTRATVRAIPHHDHLWQAARHIGRALASARTHLGRMPGTPEIDQILAPLQEAYAELRRAARALPGFQLISFEQGCCAPHTGTPQTRGGQDGLGHVVANKDLEHK
jgi:hypothetical protein